MPTPRPLPASVEQLAADLRRLARLGPVERAARSRALVDVAKAVLSAAADDAVAEAVEASCSAQVARELGVTPPAVTKALVRRRARLGQVGGEEDAGSEVKRGCISPSLGVK